MRPEERKRAIICTQGSDIWHACRVGRITGSRIDDLLAPPTTRASNRKGKSCPAGTEALVREDYRNDLVLERIYERAVDHPTNKYMLEGIEREPISRMLYEADHQVVVERVGFQLHPVWDWAGASVDGLIGLEGGLELKNPSEKRHESYVLDIDSLVQEYKGQCLMGLICYPLRDWWDIYSFNPFPRDNDRKRVKFRFHRSDWAETISAIECELERFNEQVEAEIVRRGLAATQWKQSEQLRAEPAPEESGAAFDPSGAEFAYLDGIEVAP